MTNEERRLLLLIARAVADADEDKASKLGTTSNLTDEIRKLVETIGAR